MTYQRELLRTTERLRQLPDVRLRQQEQAFRSVLAVMTDRPLPVLAPYAWGDQLWLVGREVPEPEQPALLALLVDLRRSFDVLP